MHKFGAAILRVVIYNNDLEVEVILWLAEGSEAAVEMVFCIPVNNENADHLSLAMMLPEG